MLMGITLSFDECKNVRPSASGMLQLHGVLPRVLLRLQGPSESGERQSLGSVSLTDDIYATMVTTVHHGISWLVCRVIFTAYAESFKQHRCRGENRAE